MAALLLELIIHHKQDTGESSYHSSIGLVVVYSKTEYIVKFTFFSQLTKIFKFQGE